MLRRLFLGVFVAASVASCGGGGDGGSPQPPFAPATQANLTSANAASFGTAVDLAARMAATMRLGQFLTLTATPGTLTDGGCFALGAGSATVVVTPSTGSVSGTSTYTNFDRCVGLRLTGTANINGTLSGAQVDALNFSVSNLAFTTGTQNYQMSGSAALQWTPGAFGAVSYTMTLNATVTGAASLRLENFRIEADLAAGIERLFISGRLATAEGFVDVSPTAARVDLPVPSTGLQNGSVQLTGATTIATVFFNGGGLPPTVTSVVPR